MAGHEKHIHIRTVLSLRGRHQADHEQAMSRSDREKAAYKKQEQEIYMALAGIFDFTGELSPQRLAEKIREDWKLYRKPKPQKVFVGLARPAELKESSLTQEELLKEFIELNMRAVRLISPKLAGYKLEIIKGLIKAALPSLKKGSLETIKTDSRPQMRLVLKTGTNNR